MLMLLPSIIFFLVVMYGITHICAWDVYSRKGVGFVSMPVKNNVEIYGNLFR